MTSELPIPRITFDTNVCNLLHDPEKRPDNVSPEDARKLRKAIEDRRIDAFISEATLLIEVLSFEKKLEYLSVAFTPSPRPTADARSLARFEDLSNIGVRMLHAPLIGAEIFIEGLRWADDIKFDEKERLQRFFFVYRPPTSAPDTPQLWRSFAAHRRSVAISWRGENRPELLYGTFADKMGQCSQRSLEDRKSARWTRAVQVQGRRHD